MKTTKPFITSLVIKIIVFIVISTALFVILDACAPVITNDVALGQLENDDMSWSVMNAWYQIQNYAWCVYAAIGLTVTASIGKDCVKFIKMKKEELE